MHNGGRGGSYHSGRFAPFTMFPPPGAFTHTSPSRATLGFHSQALSSGFAGPRRTVTRNRQFSLATDTARTPVRTMPPQ